MGGKHHDASIVLQAWNIELSRPRNTASVSNPAIAAGKFAFWRDAIGGKETEHPVASQLISLIRKHHWPQNLMLRIVDAKEEDCYRTSFAVLKDLENYYKFSEGALNQLLALSVLPKLSDNLVSGLEHYSIASGIATRLLPSSLKARISGLDPGFPLELLQDYGLVHGDIFSQSKWLSGPEIAPIIKDLASVAESHLMDAKKILYQEIKSLEPYLKKNMAELLLHMAVVDNYMSRLKKFDYNLELFKQTKDGLLPLKLWWSHKIYRHLKS